MEQNSSENTNDQAAAEETAAAPRRRASRRVSTAVGASAAETPDTGASGETAPAAAESGTDAAPTAEAPKKRTTRTRKKAADAESADSASTSSVEVQAPAETPSAAADAAQPASDAAATETAAPKKRTTRTRKKAADAETAPAAADGADQNAEQVSNEGAAQSVEAAESAPATAPKRTTRSRKAQPSTTADAAPEQTGEGAERSETQSDAPQTEAGTDASSQETQGQNGSDDASKGDQGKGKSGRGGRSGKNGKGQNGQGQNGQGQNGQGRDGNQGEKAEKTDRSETDKSEKNAKGEGSKNEGGDKSGGNDRNDRGGDSSRSTRTRQRDRKRRGQGDDFEPEIADDDVLLPVAGILDVLDNYAFVRTSGYLPGTSDVYVSLGQVKKYGLRKGDAVTGAIRQPREGDGNGRQKYNAIVKVDTVNGRTADENQSRGDFAELTPLYPEDRVRLETSRENTTQRVLDVVAPLGFGQRALISGPAGAGKSTLIREIAAAVSANHPDAHLMLVTTAERPEEVTHLQRTVNGEVIASTFDRASEDHTTVAELAIERAKRLVELGHDVIVLLESLTDIARAYVDAVPTGGRNATDDPEGVAELQVKKLLASARNLENAGSLTLVATAATKTGDPADKALVKALLPVVNSTVRLSGDAAAEWIFPAVDIARTYTEREALLRGDADTAKVQRLRRELTASGAGDAARGLIERVQATATNADLLARA